MQPEPNGIAEAFLLGKDFIGDDSVCLALGDNVFYGNQLSETLMRAKKRVEKGSATIFGYPVNNPREFGIVEFDENRKALSIEEKPLKPKSNYAVPGLYFYDNNVIDIARHVKPSARGELEITAVNQVYLEAGKLHVTRMRRGMTWFDTGNPKGMHKASGFVKTVQELQGYYISCIEEIAWRKGFIDDEQLYACGKELEKTDYGKYILSLLDT